jgi:hypothetical protein
MSYDDMRIGGVGRVDPYAALAAMCDAIAAMLEQSMGGQPGAFGQSQGCHGGQGFGGGGGGVGSPSSGSCSSSGGSGGFGEGGDFNAGPNEALAPYADDIGNASKITGIDPNVLGAQIWAESRGNPDESSTNSDGTEDMGLMQIGQERWENDVLPNVTDEERAKVKEFTGKDVEDLDLTDPHDNVIAGSLELAQHVRDKGGDLEAGLMDYMDGGDESIGNRNYVDDINFFAEQLRNGELLSDEDPN